MTDLTDSWIKSIANSVYAHANGSRLVGLARSIIALAQLSIILFTSAQARFPPIGDADPGPICEGITNASIYCILGGSPVILSDIVVSTLLLFVISGFFPRYLGLVHYWATISISGSIALPDGGEAASQAVVFFMIFLSIADNRTNHWQATQTTHSRLKAVSWAASWVLRLQIAWIYLNASVAKTAVSEWTEGSAVYYVVRDPLFGSAGPFGELFRDILEIPWVALTASWGAIVIEFSIAIFVLWSSKSRKLAVLLSVALHVGFIVMIGLWSFAFIMIGSVLVACEQSWSGKHVHRNEITTPRETESSANVSGRPD